MLRLQSLRFAQFRFAAFALGVSGFLFSLVAALLLHPAFVLIWLTATTAVASMIVYYHRWAGIFARIADMKIAPRRRFGRAEREAAVDVVFREIPAEART